MGLVWSKYKLKAVLFSSGTVDLLFFKLFLFCSMLSYILLNIIDIMEYLIIVSSFFGVCLFLVPHSVRLVSNTTYLFFLQSIGFFGPGFALIGLTTAPSPSIASAWLTLAVGLKAFSHCGFLVNLQVSI